MPSPNVSEASCTASGTVATFEVDEAASGAPDVASVPVRLVESWTVPTEVTRYTHVNVASCPPRRSAAVPAGPETYAMAAVPAPIVSGAAGGATPSAVAPPVFTAVSIAVNSPGASSEGTESVAESAAGSWTSTVRAAEAVSAAPSVASAAAALAAMDAVPSAAPVKVRVTSCDAPPEACRAWR